MRHLVPDGWLLDGAVLMMLKPAFVCSILITLPTDQRPKANEPTTLVINPTTFMPRQRLQRCSFDWRLGEVLAFTICPGRPRH